MFILSSSRAKVNKSTYQMNRNEEVNILIKYPPIMAVSMLFFALFGITGVTIFRVCCDTGAGKHFRMNILTWDCVENYVAEASRGSAWEWADYVLSISSIRLILSPPTPGSADTNSKWDELLSAEDVKLEFTDFKCLGIIASHELLMYPY